MKGLVADANIQGQVEYLVQRMQADAWADFWQGLGLVLRRFEDIGLSGSSTDLEVWNVCQAEQLILITDNRNLDSEDSLEATIRRNNTSESLPVSPSPTSTSSERTTSMWSEWSRHSRLPLRIDEVRGTGRLYLPLEAEPHPRRAEDFPSRPRLASSGSRCRFFMYLAAIRGFQQVVQVRFDALARAKTVLAGRKP